MASAFAGRNQRAPGFVKGRDIASREAVTAEKRRARHNWGAGDPGPTLSAIPFLHGEHSTTTPLLTERQRLQLASIATRIRVLPRMVLYREEAAATAVFINAEGVVKVFKDMPSGKRWVTAFLFPSDVFGLAENGRYIRTAQAVTPATLYRIKTEVLMDMLRRDPDLQFSFLCKVTHELREAQRQTIAVGRRDAIGRFAMFIRQLERESGARHGRTGDIEMPMSRSDIASYLGLSLESVSRATRALEKRGVVCFPGRHVVRIINPAQFERIESTL
jgi:CRP-like cAMP-binding protein